jgi:hypothetical protein
MHISEDHEEMLPEDIAPMLTPDTAEEVLCLLLCLKLELYPTCERIEEKSDLGRLTIHEHE